MLFTWSMGLNEFDTHMATDNVYTAQSGGSFPYIFLGVELAYLIPGRMGLHEPKRYQFLNTSSESPQVLLLCSAFTGIQYL